MLGFKFAFFEPYPSLLMPGFTTAKDVDELDTVQRTSFSIGTEDPVIVTSLEFATLDFSISHAGPIMSAMVDAAGTPDNELTMWVGQRISQLVPPERCGQPIELRVESLRVQPDQQEPDEPTLLERFSFGEVPC